MEQRVMLIEEAVELHEFKIYSEDREFSLGQTNCFISAKTLKMFNIKSGNDLVGKKVLGLGDDAHLSIAQVV